MFHHLHLQALVVAGIVVVCYNLFGGIVQSVYYIHTYAFTDEGVVAFLVNDGSLRVHHIVVFEKTFTDTEVVLFYLLLCSFDRLRYHRVFYHLTLFEAHSVHYLRYTFGAEKPHKVVFERNEEDRAAGVALTSRTSSQLSVDTTRLVAFGTDDSQTAYLFHFGCELDVGTTPCHIGGDSYRAGSTRFGYYFRLFLVKLGVEDIVFYLTHRKHSRKQFGDIYRRSTHKYRAFLLYERDNLLDDSLIFLSFCLIDAVVEV